MRRRKGHRSQEEVELNLAAMLDMAFQLLAFFILTFKPAPVEGQINLRLPPPVGITRTGTADAGQKPDEKEIPKGMSTLLVSVFSNNIGTIDSMAVGDVEKEQARITTVPALEGRLNEIFSDKTTPFDQVIIQVGGRLRYDELMRVVEVCTRQTLPDGSKLSKLSFVESPEQ